VGRLCNFGAAFHRTPAYHLIRTVQFVTVRRSAEKQKTNSNSSSMITAIIFPAGVFDAVASPCAHPLARSKHDFPRQGSSGTHEAGVNHQGNDKIACIASLRRRPEEGHVESTP
jgi:hypothetical protein